MRPEGGLEIRLKADVVPCERVHGVIHILRRERYINPVLGVHGRCARDAYSREEGSKGIITADVVRDRVSDCDILESTGEDLEVVLRVAPRTETVISGVGPDRRVFKIRGI